jgi:hypothetical protein
MTPTEPPDPDSAGPSGAEFADAPPTADGAMVHRDDACAAALKAASHRAATLSRRFRASQHALTGRGAESDRPGDSGPPGAHTDSDTS